MPIIYYTFIYRRLPNFYIQSWVNAPEVGASEWTIRCSSHSLLHIFGSAKGLGNSNGMFIKRLLSSCSVCSLVELSGLFKVPFVGCLGRKSTEHQFPSYEWPCGNGGRSLLQKIYVTLPKCCHKTIVSFAAYRAHLLPWPLSCYISRIFLVDIAEVL